MALLNRLFSSRRKQQPQKGYGVSNLSQGNCKVFEFSKGQVRVLLFRECERRGRKLLFDSKAVKKVPLTSILQCSKLRKGAKAEDIKKAEAFVEITNGFGYQYTRPSTDIKPLGEMIFGSVAMAVRGTTFKVHVGGSPPVLMLTRVSTTPAKRECDHGLEDSYGSSINSMNEYFGGGSSSSEFKTATCTGSCPLDVPVPSSLTLGASQILARTDRSGHFGSLEADSGCYTNSECSAAGLPLPNSFNTALASPDSRKGSGGSLSSLRRRWLRTASTSLDLDSSQSLTKTDSAASCGSLPLNADEKPLRRTKLGIAFVINLTQHQKDSMEEFLLEHAALLESMAVRLHSAVERAYCRKDQFVSMMLDASCDLEQNVEDLLLGPRLSMPVWLGLLSSTTQHASLATGFMQELCQILEVFDTKDTNFFMSTLVTSVLTHHLGWVPTVTPGSHLCLRPSFLDGTSSPCSLSDLPKVHPYNPLWAQAMDLYGALGNPLKTSRTIIMSLASNKNRIETIEKMLRIISYFIRCAAIERQELKLEEFDLLSSLSGSSSAARVTTSQMLSTDDRTSSSSTLRSMSGKCSPLPFVCHPTSTVKSCELPGFQHKPKTLSVMESISCKSENSLIDEADSDATLKKSSNVGLRRTLSYSSRMTTSALIENKINKEKQTLHSLAFGKTREIMASQCVSDKISKLQEFGSSCPTPRPSQESCTPFDKVIFVLGDNENLIGLKGKPKISTDELDLNTIEDRGKMHEQPLSFSGSEVESGFSECESFELSPVRTGCGDIEASVAKPCDSSVALTSSKEPKLCNLKNERNTNNLTTCSKSLSNKEVVPFHEANPGLLTIQSTLTQSGKQNDVLSVSSANLRSLARSLSVNLPVCLKTVKDELCTSGVCVSCGDQIDEAEIKENLYPVRDLRHTCSNKKSMRKLRRAHSSFCVQSQSRKSLKSTSMCKNCDFDDAKSSVEDSSYTKRESYHEYEQIQDSDLKASNVIELPLPVNLALGELPETACGWGIAGSLFGGVSSRYMPERVLQGCAPLASGWEVTLKRDLLLDALHPTLDPGLTEAVAIVANVDSWEVQLVSSHTYVVDRPGTVGIRVGLSQLIANMLESVYHMWKLHASSELCLSFLENRLQEIVLRSQALSELLLTKEFCSMDNLTSSLSLEPNDVPLLLSVASTHSPEVTQRYGLSFR